MRWWQMASMGKILAINDPDPKEMTIVEHLDELRRRLIICIAVVTVGSCVGWFVKETVFKVLTGPLQPFTVSKAHPHGLEIILTKITDAFVIELKMAIAVGIALGLPVLLYQAWMFVAPAISVNARRYAVPFVVVGILLFAVGGV